MRHDWVRDRGRHHIEAGGCGLLGMVVLGLDMENGLEKAGRSFGVGIGPVGRIAVGAGEESKVAGGSEESRSSCLVLGGKGLVVGVESIAVEEAGIADVGEEERNSVVVAEEEDLHGYHHHSNLGSTSQLLCYAMLCYTMFCYVVSMMMMMKLEEGRWWGRSCSALGKPKKGGGGGRSVSLILILGGSQRHSLL